MSTAGKAALVERLLAYADLGLLESGEYSATHALTALSNVTPEIQARQEAFPKFNAIPETD